MSRHTLFVVIGFLILVGLTTTLASFYHSERTSRAVEHFEQGQQLRADGQLEAAALELRTALSLARDRVGYQLALGLTLLEAGHTREAVSYLDDVLQQDPTNGVANRARAQAARTLNGAADVATYYRRAVHGVWPPELAGDRLATRFAFVQYLLEQRQHAEALGELGELAAEVPDDSPARLRIATLLLAASAPDQAASLLRALVESSPKQAQAWQRLAEAEFDLGAYRAAASAAKRALAMGVVDPATGERLELAESVLALDPTAARLPLSERQRRSRQVLELSMAALDACVGASERSDQSDIVELRRAAAEQLEPRRRRRGEDTVDASLSVAALAWRMTRRLCPTVPSSETAVDLVMRKLDQEGPGS